MMSVAGASGAENPQTGLPLPTSIQKLEEDLCQLKAQVAQELSALAGSLQPIAAQAREVTNCCRRATEISAASQSAAAIDFLEQLLAEAEKIGLLQEKSRDLLHNLLAHLEASRSPLSRLVKLPFLLNTVGMLSRIEASRLSKADAEVSSLAGDISNIAGEIEEHVSLMAAQAERLPVLVTEGVRRMDEIRGVQHKEATDLKAHTQAVLDPLRARAEAAKTTAQGIDEGYRRIRTAIEGIVMSLQCEDIARQRLEHVQQALGQLSESMQTGGGQTAAGILALQRAQLRSTRDLVSSSIDSFLASIGSLIGHLAELTAELEALANQTGEDGRSFSAAMEDGLRAVSAAQGHYSVSTRTVVSAVETLLPAVAGMTRGASELRKIASSIRRTALNARIETAHLGDEGATMRALAAEVQHITEGSEGDARVVLDHLRAADSDLNSISTQVAEASNSRILAGNGNGSEEMVHLIESVTISSQQLAAELTQLLERSGQLHSQLQNTRELAQRSALVSEQFDRLTAQVDSVLTPLAGEAGVSITDEAASKAADLNQLYSMQSEREIHEQLFGTGAAGDTDVGMDVELF